MKRVVSAAAGLTPCGRKDSGRTMALGVSDPNRIELVKLGWREEIPI